MKTIERAVAQNLLDFVQTAHEVAPDLGAAATACGGGVAAFLGVDSPLTTVKGAGRFAYGGRHRDSRGVLSRPWRAARGVRACSMDDGRRSRVTDASRLHRRRFGGRRGARGAVRPPDAAVSDGPVSVEDWPALMLHVNEPSDLPTWRSLVDICAVLPGVVRLAVLDDRGVDCVRRTGARRRRRDFRQRRDARVGAWPWGTTGFDTAAIAICGTARLYDRRRRGGAREHVRAQLPPLRIFRRL